jgi:hypothetical protein
MNAKGLAALVVVLWLSAVFQQAVAYRWEILGARPDFFLIAISGFSPFMLRYQGTLAGFAAGLLHGAIAGANLMAYIVTRAFGGFVGAWINELRFVPTAGVVMLTTAVVTVITRLAFLFLAAPSGLGDYLTATILTAVYNGVLVWPLYALLKRILDPVYH